MAEIVDGDPVAVAAPAPPALALPAPAQEVSARTTAAFLPPRTPMVHQLLKGWQG